MKQSTDQIEELNQLEEESKNNINIRAVQNEFTAENQIMTADPLLLGDTGKKSALNNYFRDDVTGDFSKGGGDNGGDLEVGQENVYQSSRGLLKDIEEINHEEDITRVVDKWKDTNVEKSASISA